MFKIPKINSPENACERIERIPEIYIYIYIYVRCVRCVRMRSGLFIFWDFICFKITLFPMRKMYNLIGVYCG
jgi:hypothetical protein